MASSKLPPPSNANLMTRVNACLTRVFHSKPQTSHHLLVAYSGGLDSTVLLHALVAIQQQLRADKGAQFQLTLTAMHVHHGLSTHADAWVTHCQQTCMQYGVPLQVEYVQVSRQSGLGLEATARNARYAALQQTSADFICLAHHQDDQAETLLLQLMRGAGVKGLAGMAELDLTQRLLRPLLSISKIDIETYAKDNALQWIEDDSNQNTDLDRNFMRHQVMPLLISRYSGLNKTLSRTAQHMAEASHLLAELAQTDATDALAKGVYQNQQSLLVAKLVAMSEARAKNVLRWWLGLHNLMMPNAELLEQILQQLLHARADAGIHIQIAPNRSIKRYLGLAYIVKDIMPAENYHVLWQGESVVQLTPNDRLFFEPMKGQGIAQNKLANDALRIRLREGSERFRPELGRPSRTLKHILQTHKIPPWQRARMPLVFMDETLVCIPNIGVDASLAAQPEEMGMLIRWECSQ
jgi:tRNA(Ile)-lysidine synthase